MTASTAASTPVTLTGHLMDTGILARVLDDVLEYGGDYRIDRLDLGRQHEDESRALVEIKADDPELLERIVMRVQVHGANPVDPGTALTRPAPADGVFPEDFYSTTNLDTFVRLDREWIAVDRAEMDCGLVVSEPDGRRIRSRPIDWHPERGHVQAGEVGLGQLARHLQQLDQESGADPPRAGHPDRVLAIDRGHEPGQCRDIETGGECRVDIVITSPSEATDVSTQQMRRHIFHQPA